MFDNKKYYIENKEKIKKYGEQYRENNQEKIKERKRRWRENNPEILRQRRKKYREENIEQERERDKKRRMGNPKKEKSRLKKYGENNREKIKERRRKYREGNREKVRKQDRGYRKKRYTKKWYIDMCKDLKYILNNKIRLAVGNSLKGNKKGRHWEDLVGYTLEDLFKRLKKTTPEGYDWQDFIEGKFHIDHIVPISVFNFTKPEHPDFRKCWALSNLQLLLARENIIKSNKLSKPFQPSLKINQNKS